MCVHWCVYATQHFVLLRPHKVLENAFKENESKINYFWSNSVGKFLEMNKKEINNNAYK